MISTRAARLATRLAIYKALCNAFCAALCTAVLCAAPQAAANDELKELRNRIEALKKEITSAEGNRAEAADALRESERAISEANRELRNLAGERQSTEKRLQELGRDSKSARDRADGETRRLAKLIHDQYLNRERGYLRMLFSGENPAAAARELHYASYASRAEARLIDSLRGSLKELQKLAGDARDKSIELAGIETRQRAGRAQLATESEARRRVLREVSTKIRTQRKEVSTLEQNEKRLTQLILKLATMIKPAERENPKRPRTRIDAVPDNSFAGAFAALKGRLRLPVRGELAGRFGSQREDGGTTWKGLFIKTTQGEEVKSVAPGRVVFADWMRGFGNLLIVDHGSEYLSIYGNNETLFKQAGETVASGDTIARTGNSGGNPETGLYFEVRHKGAPFDPMNWVKK